MQNDNEKILELKEEIKFLNSKLNENNMIADQTKEYLFVLEYENDKKNEEIHQIKINSKNELDELNNKYQKKIKEHENKINLLEKNIDNEKKTINKLKKENNRLKNEINILQSTFSWKVTKPLRWLKNLF